ncbi:MAG: patatin-like phospholipase family protein, partial [Thermoanaerobaculia bacterium]|nr:patatin-like phospholipase family protein [Thermoanaerobaculia bacterium]
FNDLFVYVGVSAGSFIAANLANGLTTAQMCRAIVKHEPGEHPFTPETFFTPAVGEFVRRGVSIPRLISQALAQFARDPEDRSLADSMTRLARALPVGVFDNEPIRAYLRNIYSLPGRTDDFRELRHQLFVVSSELDSGRAVRFGEPGWDHVPISRAVQASSSLPGLYSPVEIDGRFYVDGVLLKTLHASVALDAGVKLLLCINPIVPVDLTDAEGLGGLTERQLVRRGLPTVLSQTFRTLIHSRLTVGMANYEKRYKDADVVLIEPARGDYKMFFTNVFSFSARRTVAAHAYRATRRDLLARYDQLAPLLRRHGAILHREILEDSTRDLWEGVGLPADRAPRASGHETLRRLDGALDRLQHLLD